MENSEKSSSPAPSSSAAGGKEKIEKQARQLAYDTRYKVKQSMAANKGGKMDPAAVRKAYIAQLGKSPSSPPVKARAKEMLVGEQFINTDQLVHKSAVSVLEKVFSEKYKKSKSKKPEGGDRRPGVGCEDIKEDSGEKTYKVRVTDKKTNNTYVRMATRAKISELRSNPNISSVEMTGYGSPTKSEKHSGKNTAAVKSGKGDEVSGKDDKINLKKESYSSLRSENFDGFLELVEKKDKKKSKITGEGVNNKKLIKVFPDDVEEQVDPAMNNKNDIDSKLKKQNQLKKQVLQKKLQAVRSGGGEDITASYQPEGEVTEDAEYGYDKDGDSLNPKDIKKKNEKDPNGEAKKQEEEDPRGMATKINLVRNKLRAMGLKMSHDPEGETIEESEKVAQGARKRAQELGAARRKREGVNRGVDKNERAGYKLSQAASSSDSSLETQRTKKKRPAGDDTSQIGHYKNRDAKRTTSKTGKPLKKPVNKLSLSQRVDHHSNKALNRRDPKQNPKHTANESLWDAYTKVYEHHQKDANGKVIEHGDGSPSSLDEEGYDRMRDDRLVKYGIGHDGSDKSGPSPRPTGKQPKGDTNYQKEMKKKHGGKLPSAVDVVRAKIQAKHGKGAIMDTKKKS